VAVKELNGMLISNNQLDETIHRIANSLSNLVYLIINS